MDAVPSDQEPTPSPLVPDQTFDRTFLQTFSILSALCAGVFVAALDVTIITTALPSIAAHFQSSSAYTWIGSSYILANTATVPAWGKLSDIWGRKPLLLVGTVIFFTGSLICAVSDTIALFLFGRAVQGLGAAGLITLVNICVCDLFSLRDRGLYFGLLSVVWALASGVGPVLGGVFTEKASWRWCFWINLPISGLVFLILWFTLNLETPNTPIWSGLKAVDWTGCLFVIGSTIMLLLGLDFGGVTHPWNSATVICLIVFAGVLLGLFVVNEWKLVKYPVIPLALFNHRSGIASFLVCFCHGYIFMGEAYYLPLYFQAVLGSSPIMSGVYILPFVLAITASAALTGLFIQKTGLYLPAMWLGLIAMTLGVGLLINLDVTAEWGKIMGFQIIAGIGIGLNFEGPLLALQAIVGAENTATATATIGFVRTLSTAISVVIGTVMFQNQMARKGSQLISALGEKIASLVSGASMANIGIIDTLPLDQKLVAREAIHESLKTVWIMYVAFAAVGLVAGIFVEGHHLDTEHTAPVLGLRDNDDH
ncbi:Major facilitator superfamily domain general substrate transporter [Penicillium cf. griseofulvum]|uniref:Efflux pump dotC n=1 Tax=Penicillium cf. griseofulvum TaxID=2972120 RepID=A0A9W9MSA5_9EURO|nr:Major facilitator superfamily domain general substrate transporter [Penicillium cf. griseofulvum]KAJ5440388.1 Major facilitator superfamily domain general substrate transporter [Penicillium cf. griseofulvum]KAJ5448435.1 Major facilitator superfamily domain general substrate transporter [Penicillium cf. griseofulvum]